MPFRSWMRKNSTDKKSGRSAPPFSVAPALGPLHLAGGRLRRGVALQARVGLEAEAGLLHVVLHLFRPAPGSGLVHRGEIKRLDELVVGLAHLDLARVAL